MSPRSDRCRRMISAHKQCDNVKKEEHHHCASCHEDYKNWNKSIRKMEETLPYLKLMILEHGARDYITFAMMKLATTLWHTRMRLGNAFFKYTDATHWKRMRQIKEGAEQLNRARVNPIDADLLSYAFTRDPELLGSWYSPPQTLVNFWQWYSESCGPCFRHSCAATSYF